MVDIENLARRNDTSIFALNLIQSIVEGIKKFRLGSDVEYSYIKEKLDKLNTLVEQEIK